MISRSRLLVYKFSHYKDVVSKFKNFEQFTAMNTIIYIFLLIAGFAVSISNVIALPLASHENKSTIYPFLIYLCVKLWMILVVPYLQPLLWLSLQESQLLGPWFPGG